MCLLVTLTHVNQSVSQSIHKPVNHQVKYTNANKNRTVSPTGVQTQTKIQQSHQLDCRHKQKLNSLANWTADTNKNRTVSPTGLQTQTKLQQFHQLDCRHKQSPDSLANWTADTNKNPTVSPTGLQTQDLTLYGWPGKTPR